MSYVTERYDLEKMSSEEIKAVIAAAPEVEPITGMRRCDSYMFEEGPVYLPTPAYDAYTLPVYDPEWEEFNWTKIDMDNDFTREDQVLCTLDDLRERPDFEEIKKFYGVKKDSVALKNILNEIC